MRKATRTLGALIVGAALVSVLAAPAHAVETAAPTLAELETVLFAPDVAAAPAEATEATASPEPAPSLGQPEPEPLSSGIFYICLNSDFFCGGPCPSGTHCATEACGSPFNACCTFQASCVGGCQVSPGCQSLCSSCRDL